MVDQKLLDYVRDNMKKGVKPDDIRLALLESGWPNDQIDMGMAQAGATSPAPMPGNAPVTGTGKPAKEKKSGHKKLILLLIVLMVLIVAFLMVAANIVKTFSDMFPGSMDGINSILSGSTGG